MLNAELYRTLKNWIPLCPSIYFLFLILELLKILNLEQIHKFCSELLEVIEILPCLVPDKAHDDVLEMQIYEFNYLNFKCACVYII
jgi:hypothetical protein